MSLENYDRDYKPIPATQEQIREQWKPLTKEEIIALINGVDDEIENWKHMNSICLERGNFRHSVVDVCNLQILKAFQQGLTVAAGGAAKPTVDLVGFIDKVQIIPR